MKGITFKKETESFYISVFLKSFECFLDLFLINIGEELIIIIIIIIIIINNFIQLSYNVSSES